MDCINLELLHGPQRRQEGSEQSCSERQLERGGSIAEICCTTCECAGVSGTEDGPSQGIATEIWVEAAADLQLEQPCGIKLCKETQKVLLWKKTNSKCENLRFTIITLGCFYFWLDFSLPASFTSILQYLYQEKHWLLLLSCLSEQKGRKYQSYKKISSPPQDIYKTSVWWGYLEHNVIWKLSTLALNNLYAMITNSHFMNIEVCGVDGLAYGLLHCSSSRWSSDTWRHPETGRYRTGRCCTDGMSDSALFSQERDQSR